MRDTQRRGLRRQPRRSGRRGLGWAAGGAIVVALLVGTAACSGASSDSSAIGEVAASSESSQVAAADMAAGHAESQADSGSTAGAGHAAASSAATAPGAPNAGVNYDTASDAAASGVTALATDRQIIRTADVTLAIEVKPQDDEKSVSAADLAQAASRAARQVRGLATLPGAYVSGSDGHGSSVTVTLRIPAGAYDDVMGRLAAIGAVTNESEATQDVTGEMVDVASRLATMRASVDRLRALMTDAQSMKDVIALESELTQRESDLESLERQQVSLKDQVALSTITVTVNADAAPVNAVAKPTVKRAAFLSGLIAGWHGLQAVGRVMATIAGALLPFLPAIALILALVWLMARRTRRARALTVAVAPEQGSQA